MTRGSGQLHANIYVQSAKLNYRRAVLLYGTVSSFEHQPSIGGHLKAKVVQVQVNNSPVVLSERGAGWSCGPSYDLSALCEPLDTFVPPGICTGNFVCCKSACEPLSTVCWIFVNRIQPQLA